MELSGIESKIEGILFAAGEPVSMHRISAVLEISLDTVQQCAKRIAAGYEEENRGIRMVQMEDKLQLCSAPAYGPLIGQVLEVRLPPKLSKTALEVLSIVAYFQPVTRMYIDQIRGVDSAYTVSLLVERGLIAACGKLEVPGRPTIYKTTDQFLRTMGIASLEELPALPALSMEEGQAALQERIAALKQKEDTLT